MPPTGSRGLESPFSPPEANNMRLYDPHSHELSPPSLSPLNLSALLPKEDANSENHRSSESALHVPHRVRKEKIPKKKVILEVLKRLQDAKLIAIHFPDYHSNMDGHSRSGLRIKIIRFETKITKISE